MKKIRIPNRIFFQQARNALIIGTILVAFSSAIQISSRLSDEQKKIASGITLLLEAEELSAAQAAYNIDEELSKICVKRFLQAPFIYKATIEDDFGSVIASSSSERARVPALFGRLASFIKIDDLYSRPLFFGKGKMKVGVIRIYVDKTEIVGSLLEDLWGTFTDRFFTMVVLFAILLLVFYLTITKPIVGVANALSSLEESELEGIQILVPSKHVNNELGLLINTVNGLLLRIMERTEELRRSETEKTLILDNAGDLIAYHDTNHNIQWVNKAYLEFTGLSLAEIKGKKCYHAWGLDRICSGCPVMRSVVTDKPERYELSPENQPFWPEDHGSWSVSAAPVKDASGNIIGAIEISHDITEQKKMEEELAKYRLHLEGLVRERTRQLEEANKELDAFSYSVSHDLKAPLRALNGFSKIIIEDYAEQLDAQGRHALDLICANAKKMEQLINDLLEFAHVSRQEIKLSRVDMKGLAKSVFDDLKATIQEGRDVRLEVKEIPCAYADLSMMRQVFTNLFSNAIKFSRNKQSALIEVGSVTAGKEEVYYLKDNGVGFDMKYVDKIFGVFQRLHAESEFEGTGVGLAIVQRAIIKQGGRVWAEGKVNEGATFYFSLPK